MEKKFRIGLTMAGAVSAGAYTGGVLDYLFQVMDAWEKAKAEKNPNVPYHEISIDIISGASAGGITGAMAVLDLCSEQRYPMIPTKRNDIEYSKKNVFYHSWVNLLQDDMLPLLLNPSDIDRNGKIVSLLNSEFIETVAERAIVCLPHCATAPPPYVNPQMELILSLSNLRGFKYNLKFSAEGSSTHSMVQHRDYAFFRLGDVYGGDGRIPLNLQKKIGLEELKQVAPATGAFPIGLAYRKFVRKKKYIIENKDLIFYHKGISEIEEFSEHNLEEDYITFNVDGGMLNNEPFDLTMKLMAKTSSNNQVANTEELEKQEKDFDATIIMIDPFPSDDSKSITSLKAGAPEELTKKEKEKIEKFPYDLFEVLMHIYKSLRGEVLFKGEDIVEAFSKSDFSRFMIAPRRRKKINADGKESEQVLDGSVAIACGAIDGFAGFFDKRFREHDFYLGRANCQGFLRKYFRVKLENGKPVNPLFAKGYSLEAIKEYKFQDEDEKKKYTIPEDAPWYVPIIPDLFKNDSSFDEKPMDYPKYDLEKFVQQKEAVLKRINLLGRHLIPTPILKVLFKLWMFFGKGSLFNKLKGKIGDQFKKWDLL